MKLLQNQPTHLAKPANAPSRRKSANVESPPAPAEVPMGVKPNATCPKRAISIPQNIANNTNTTMTPQNQELAAPLRAQDTSNKKSEPHREPDIRGRRPASTSPQPAALVDDDVASGAASRAVSQKIAGQPQRVGATVREIEPSGAEDHDPVLEFTLIDGSKVFSPTTLELPAGRNSISKEKRAAKGVRAMAVAPAAERAVETTETLTPAERHKLRSKLRSCEKTYKQCSDSWQAGPAALLQILDKKLYRGKGFTEFGRYCKKELGKGKSTVYRQIAVGEVYREVASTGATLPTSERQMRPLLKLRQPDQDPTIWSERVKDVWRQVVQDAELSRTPITEKRVLRAVKQLGFEPPPKESPLESDREKRWLKLAGLLDHEKEFWPGKHQDDLRGRICGVVQEWQATEDRRLELNECSPAPSLAPADEIVLTAELEADAKPTSADEELAAPLAVAPKPPAEAPVLGAKRRQAVTAETTEDDDAVTAEIDKRDKAALAAEATGSNFPCFPAGRNSELELVLGAISKQSPERHANILRLTEAGVANFQRLQPRKLPKS